MDPKRARSRWLVGLGAGLAISAACRHRPPIDAAAGDHHTISAGVPAPFGPPRAADPHARGAVYLAAIAGQVQPAWAQFLEDCRTRLAPAHPLNDRALVATAALAIDKTGAFTIETFAASTSADFDAAVRGVLRDVASRRLAPPPADLVADDDLVHVTWLFARDARQAGAATAAVGDHFLSVLEVIDKELAAHQLSRAAARARRAAATGEADGFAAVERVMVGAIALAIDDDTTDATTRALAIGAIGKAHLVELAPVVRRFLSPTTSSQLRIAATEVATALADTDALPAIARALPGDLADPALAAADATAILRIDHVFQRQAGSDRAPPQYGTMAAKDIAKPLAKLGAKRAATPVQLGALHAFARLPTASLVPVLVGAFGRGDARMRAAICAAVGPLPAARAVVARGLADADSGVRRACAEAAMVTPFSPWPKAPRARPGVGLEAPLHKLATDRDRSARAAALVALAAIRDLTPAEVAAIPDDDRDVRWEVVDGVPDGGAGNEVLWRRLAADADVDIRARALARVGAAAPELVAAAIADHEPAIRAAAARSGGATDAALAHLVDDADARTAHAAFAQLAHRRGRIAIADLGLARLTAAETPGARVDAALAWLLAP